MNASTLSGHEKAKLIEEASQYYERLINGERCNVVQAVIKIRSLIQRAGCSLAVLEPETPQDKLGEAEDRIRTFLEDKLGRIPADEKSHLLREAWEYYEMLKTGHPCNIVATVQRLRIAINNAGVTLAALEPEVPEDRKQEVESRIAKYLETLEFTQSNRPDENPPPSFLHRRNGRKIRNRIAEIAENNSANPSFPPDAPRPGGVGR